MNDDHVPSLSLIVDQLTVRIEYLDVHGPADEGEALRKARAILVDHALRERRNISIIQTILEHLHLRPAA